MRALLHSLIFFVASSSFASGHAQTAKVVSSPVHFGQRGYYTNISIGTRRSRFASRSTLSARRAQLTQNGIKGPTSRGNSRKENLFKILVVLCLTNRRVLLPRVAAVSVLVLGPGEGGGVSFGQRHPCRFVLESVVNIAHIWADFALKRSIFRRSALSGGPKWLLDNLLECWSKAPKFGRILL